MMDAIKTINRMSNDQQNSFYASLIEKGFPQEDIRAIQAFAFYTKLFDSKELFDAVKIEMGKRLYDEFTA